MNPDSSFLFLLERTGVPHSGHMAPTAVLFPLLDAPHLHVAPWVGPKSFSLKAPSSVNVPSGLKNLGSFTSRNMRLPSGPVIPVSACSSMSSSVRIEDRRFGESRLFSLYVATASFISDVTISKSGSGGR